MDFNSNPPIVKTDGTMSADEGCSSISDTNGKLLFYTNGIKVWNKNHQVMSNGDSLHGQQSSSQSALIIKKPNSNNMYYIFTVDAQAGLNGFEYSEVDMNLDGGNGGVTTFKNIRLLNQSCEKLAAVKHTNNRDIWVLVHQWNSDAFNAYLITPAGIDTNAVISNIGTFINSDVSGDNAAGIIKNSSNGKKIAMTNYDQKIVQLFDFNRMNSSRFYLGVKSGKG